MAVSSDPSSACAPSLVGGYDCQFIKPPPESLQCPICLLPFKEPVLLSCCGQNGCDSCIGRIKAAGHPCPVCQQPFQTMIEKKLQRAVLDLCVFCSRKREGCPWEGELRELASHSQRDCGYVEEACRYGCGRCYQRRLLSDHEKDECPQRPPEVVTRSLIRKMAERMDTLEQIHQQDQIKLKALQDSLSNVLVRLRDLEKSRDEDQVKLAAMGRAQCKDQTKLASLQEENENLSRKMAEFGPMWLMDPKGTVSSHYVPCIIVMTDFSNHKSSADQWYSRPFYSVPKGYKLCLRVHANGYGVGKGTHVSLYVCIMKGENDDQLQWPFEHTVTYRIFNWKKDEIHQRGAIPFKNATAKYNTRVVSGERASGGYGHDQALPHTLLFDCDDSDISYLHQGCLCVQVQKVEPPK